MATTSNVASKLSRCGGGAAGRGGGAAGAAAVAATCAGGVVVEALLVAGRWYISPSAASTSLALANRSPGRFSNILATTARARGFSPSGNRGSYGSCDRRSAITRALGIPSNGLRPISSHHRITPSEKMSLRSSSDSSSPVCSGLAVA